MNNQNETRCDDAPWWEQEVEKAVRSVREGRSAIATVLCGEQEEVHVRSVVNGIESAASSSDARRVVAYVRRYSAEEYDFDFDDGVEVVVAQRPEFLELYSRSRRLSDRLVRRALFELLTGGSTEDLAGVLAAFIKNGWDDEGQDCAAGRLAEGPTSGLNYWMTGEA